MKLYAVHRTREGYAREDAHTSDVIGIYTDQEVARRVAVISYGQWQEVEVDYIPPGIKADATAYGVTL